MSIKNKVFDIRNVIGKLKKNQTNPFYNSQYLDLNELLDELQPLLEANKILLTQPVKDNKVYSIIEDLEDNSLMDSFITLPDIQDPQKIGSAITYFRRYSLKSLFAISEEDDDANKTVPATSSSDDKKWLNATDKSGALNDRGKKTARAIFNGETDWKKIQQTHKVSKKDRSAVDDAVMDMDK